MKSGELDGRQWRVGVSAMRTSGKGGARAVARGTVHEGQRKKVDDAQWLLCVETKGKNGEEGAGRDAQLREREMGQAWGPVRRA
jgi:hypothetical protein